MVHRQHQLHSTPQGNFTVVIAHEAYNLCPFVSTRSLMVDRRTAKDLQTLEELYKGAIWFKQDQPEPLIGDQNCPYLAQTYGLPRRSCLTAFLDAENDDMIQCRFERCFAFTFSTIDNALKHLREHHFGNRPFACSSANGTTW